MQNVGLLFQARFTRKKYGFIAVPRTIRCYQYSAFCFTIREFGQKISHRKTNDSQRKLVLCGKLVGSLWQILESDLYAAPQHRPLGVQL